MASSSTLQLTRQLNRKSRRISELRNTELSRIGAELRKHPVDGFSAGLVDDDNVYEWEFTIFGFLPSLLRRSQGLADAENSPPDTLYEGGFFRATMSFPQDFPLNPPKMKFLTEMWHPNSQSTAHRHGVLPRRSPSKNQPISPRFRRFFVLQFFVSWLRSAVATHRDCEGELE